MVVGAGALPPKVVVVSIRSVSPLAASVSKLSLLFFSSAKR